MSYSRARTASASLLVIVLGARGTEACTTDTVVSPPPSGTSTCATDPTVSCPNGTGFSCTGNDQPEDSESSLICSYGVPGNAGAALFCCLHAVASSVTTCGPDSTVAGCAPGSFGFSCADSSEPPSAAYPSLQCSAPTQGNAGTAIYCCTD